MWNNEVLNTVIHEKQIPAPKYFSPLVTKVFQISFANGSELTGPGPDRKWGTCCGLQRTVRK
uniref:Uncharacterized protein n=1 Tax=Anguilla anguilla TaxID=7936 RepID=A0A0E9RU64_ANGAN